MKHSHEKSKGLVPFGVCSEICDRFWRYEIDVQELYEAEWKEVASDDAQ